MAKPREKGTENQQNRTQAETVDVRSINPTSPGAKNMETIVRQRRKKSKIKIIKRREMEMMPEGAKTIDGKAELIQMLIPLGLKAVGDLLQEELKTLAGNRYRHESGPMRWGKQAGSVYLGDEKFR